MQTDVHHLPECPTCHGSMALARRWARLGSLPELSTFECKRCGIVFTEVSGGDPLPERASALHEQPYHAQH